MNQQSPSRLRAEILIVLALSFGMSGLRAVLKLIDSLVDPVPLNEQSETLNASRSTTAWLDIALQMASAGTIFAYGALALFLLVTGSHHRMIIRPDLRDFAWGAGLATLIGIPGLAFYLTALNVGWTKEIVPTSFDNAWVELPSLLLFSAANAFGEEVVVVMYLFTRFGQLGWRLPAILAATSLLRGSYHLYQGVSAGFGNIAMGLIFGYFYHRTGRVWPLIIAHFLIDAVAFVGYAVLDNLGILPFT